MVQFTLKYHLSFGLTENYIQICHGKKIPNFFMKKDNLFKEGLYDKCQINIDI